MSILIKGIDLPKDAQAVQISYWTKDGHYITESYPPSRIVEIPTPHGRLIDADKLCNEFSNRCPGDCGCCGESRDDIYDCGLIINAPTIVEEEP